MPTRSSPWRLEVSTYGEVLEPLLGFVVLLPAEGTTPQVGFGVGFGVGLVGVVGVVLLARSSGARQNSEWHDQACVATRTQNVGRKHCVTVTNMEKRQGESSTEELPHAS